MLCLDSWRIDLLEMHLLLIGVMSRRPWNMLIYYHYYLNLPGHFYNFRVSRSIKMIFFGKIERLQYQVFPKKFVKFSFPTHILSYLGK